ncbi:MAG: DUF4359 domain-containing protein [Scytolyngbya sp. HA4215-MV1]|nr:DUF4359 domain-containing protein [Scytolyngbya sp. HA4215-MV1]
MKNLNVVAAVAGVALLAGSIGLAGSNPSPSAYEDFAVQKLSQFLKDDACKKLIFGLQNQCPEWIDDNQSTIKEFIAQNTQRQNYIFFSFYTTDLSARSLLPSIPLISRLPSYRFRTVGALQNFYIYEAKRQ